MTAHYGEAAHALLHELADGAESVGDVVHPRDMHLLGLRLGLVIATARPEFARVLLALLTGEWTPDELRATLAADDAAFVARLPAAVLQ